LRDYELEDVIDVMQALYVEEGEVIIQEGDPGELFYILEEGTRSFSLPPTYLVPTPPSERCYI
jgi:CRP-like cAMP-binding protein